jgi:hypothetical protein
MSEILYDRSFEKKDNTGCKTTVLAKPCLFEWTQILAYLDNVYMGGILLIIFYAFIYFFSHLFQPFGIRWACYYKNNHVGGVMVIVLF